LTVDRAERRVAVDRADEFGSWCVTMAVVREPDDHTLADETFGGCGDAACPTGHLPMQD
jgi:hypothetical protein